MKNTIWNIRVRLGDWIRVLLRRIRPTKERIVLEIHESDLRIGDSNG